MPGDFSFPVNDPICEDKELRFIGSCNELNAAYAAEGYARVKGPAASIQLTAPVSSMRSAASPEPMRASAGLPSCRAIEPGHAASSRSGASYAGERRVRLVLPHDRAGGRRAYHHHARELHRREPRRLLAVDKHSIDGGSKRIRSEPLRPSSSEPCRASRSRAICATIWLAAAGSLRWPRPSSLAGSR